MVSCVQPYSILRVSIAPILFTSAERRTGAMYRYEPVSPVSLYLHNPGSFTLDGVSLMTYGKISQGPRARCQQNPDLPLA